MKLSLFIARRYFLSKQNTNAINVISIVSMVGVAVGTFALIVVLSVFNGFEQLVLSLYNSFYPDIRITAVEGKTFIPDENTLHQLKQIREVAHISQVVEESALLRYGTKEHVVILKGVDEQYAEVTQVKDKIIRGSYKLERDGYDGAVLGSGIEIFLGINIEDPFTAIQVYVPRRGTSATGLMGEQAFNRGVVYPTGTFAIQQEFDTKYAIVPIHFVRNLLDYRENEISALELRLRSEADLSVVQKKISALLGSSFEVKDRYQQNEILYKLMRTERWAVYLILTLILLVAAFNIIGALTMLVIEKHRDIAVLKSMGADSSLIQKIFLLEGVLIAFTGAAVGAIVAVLLCWVQQEFGLLRIPGTGTFVVDVYPVQMQAVDFFLVFATVFVITMLASWYPARKAALLQAVWKEE